ncbi:MBL fold metallo-hydrolase [Coriobacteriales bacterium OH1046]|nr:MBL fold metallo-hydrolase [Coriobacteriales bacterium OH1046]
MDAGFITINTHSSIRIDAGPGALCYVDPFRFEAAPHDADAVLVTHAHFDHFSPEDLMRVIREDTVFVAPAGMEGNFIGTGIDLGNVTFISPRSACELLPGLHVEAVPAYNLDKPFHPEDEGWLGYIITCADGTRTYVAGDTDDLPENRSLVCDIALVPAGGTYTMDAVEAAAFVNALAPKIAVPTHYGSVAGVPEDGRVFAAAVDPAIETVLKL